LPFALALHVTSRTLQLEADLAPIPQKVLVVVVVVAVSKEGEVVGQRPCLCSHYSLVLAAAAAAADGLV